MTIWSCDQICKCVFWSHEQNFLRLLVHTTMTILYDELIKLTEINTKLEDLAQTSQAQVEVTEELLHIVEEK